jgi:hypothetical protein
MKPFVTVPIAVAPLRRIKQPRAVQYRWASKRSLLNRFQHFIEATDWEDRYICNTLIDKICLGGIVVSALYFTTSLVSSLLK